MHGLVYTAFVFHDFYESTHGFFFGLIISVISFQSDTFSNAIYSIPVNLFPALGYKSV